MNLSTPNLLLSSRNADLKRKNTKLNYLHKPRFILAAIVLILGLSLITKASYIQLKAQLAQILIAHAYAQQINQQTPQKPWPWADTQILAKLEINGKTDYILANASMRNLAFGPAHMSQTVSPGKVGNSVIVGHRDTHFSHLQHVKVGQTINLDNMGTQVAYRVEEIMIVDASQVSVLNELPSKVESSALTLITCYPFNGIDPNPTQRFVIRAIKIN